MSRVAAKLASDEARDPTLDQTLVQMLLAHLTESDLAVLLEVYRSLMDPGVISGVSAWSPPPGFPTLLEHLSVLPYFSSVYETEQSDDETSEHTSKTSNGTESGAAQPRARFAATRASRAAVALPSFPPSTCGADCTAIATRLYVNWAAGAFSTQVLKDVFVGSLSVVAGRIATCGDVLLACVVDTLTTGCDLRGTLLQMPACGINAVAQAAGIAVGGPFYSLFILINYLDVIYNAQLAWQTALAACVAFQGSEACCTARGNNLCVAPNGGQACRSNSALQMDVHNCGACANDCAAPNQPTLSACISSSAYRTYARTGTCTAGACDTAGTNYSCPAGTACIDTPGGGVLCNPVCTPSCSGRTCGNDGCGGNCGTCASGLTCTAGICAAQCPAGTASLVCGSQTFCAPPGSACCTLNNTTYPAYASTTYLSAPASSVPYAIIPTPGWCAPGYQCASYAFAGTPTVNICLQSGATLCGAGGVPGGICSPGTTCVGTTPNIVCSVPSCSGILAGLYSGTNPLCPQGTCSTFFSPNAPYCRY